MADQEQDKNSILLDFLAATSTEDIARALEILQSTEWNLLAAVNQVVPQQFSPVPESTSPAVSPSVPFGVPESGMVSVGQSSFGNTSVDDIDNTRGSTAAAFVTASTTLSYRSGPRQVSSSLCFIVECGQQTHTLTLQDHMSVGDVKSLLSLETKVDVSDIVLHGWPRNASPDDYVLLRSLRLPSETRLVMISLAAARTLRLKVHFFSDVIQLSVLDFVNVGQVKDRLRQERPSLPSDYVIDGWGEGQKVMNSTILRHLNLPDEPVLVMRLPDSVTNGQSGNNVTVEVTVNGENHTVTLSPTESVLDVKRQFATSTGIPVKKQVWVGWPSSAGDKVPLWQLTFDSPVHHLTLSKQQPIMMSDATDSEDEELSDDFMDAYEDLDNSSFDLMHRPKPPMPSDVEDPTELLLCFLTEFEARFGSEHPDFYLGPFQEALKTAFTGKAQNRRPLVIYIHHDGSVLSNIFCSSILCTDAVVNFINQNCLFWAWDITHDKNRAKLLDQVSQQFGTVAADSFRIVDLEKLPMLFVVTQTGNSMSSLEISASLNGNVSLDEVMGNLFSAVEEYSEAKERIAQEEEERESRERVKAEQDAAYQESLRVDRQKEEGRVRAEEETRLKEALEASAREAAIAEAELVAQERERKEQEMAQQLPDEPPASCQDVSVVCMRLPGGERITRRFLTEERLQVLVYWMGSRGFLPSEYVLLSSYPRRKLSTLDLNQTLQEAGLGKKEMLIVEER